MAWRQVRLVAVGIGVGSLKRVPELDLRGGDSGMVAMVEVHHLWHRKAGGRQLPTNQGVMVVVVVTANFEAAKLQF